MVRSGLTAFLLLVMGSQQIGSAGELPSIVVNMPPMPTPVDQPAPPPPGASAKMDFATQRPTPPPQDPPAKTETDVAKTPAAAEADALKKLGEAVEKLGKNLTVLTGKEDWKVVVFGELRGELVYGAERPVTISAPFFLTPDSPFGLSQDTVEVHGKSTLLGVLVNGPQICDYKAGGLVLGALYSESFIRDIYGFLPIQAFGELRNDTQRFAAGLQLDVFNPLNPNMINFNNLFASGNAGLYRGQIRGEHFSYPTPESQVTAQVAVGDPLPTTVSEAFRISEPTGWPNLDARVALALGPVEGEGLEARRPIEVGVSGFVGQVRTTDATIGRRVVADAWGLGVDARWKFSQRCGAQAEVFVGRTLGTYGGGILQTVNTLTFEGIHSKGGWAELYYYLTPCVHVHGGYGIDDPRDADVAPLQLMRNETYFTTLYWNVTEDFRLGIELSYRESTYRAALDNDGFLVHTQALWKF